MKHFILFALTLGFALTCSAAHGSGESAVVPPNSGRVPCLSGWLEIHGVGCYLFSTSSSRSWEQAVTDCQNMGGHLVEIETEDENDELKVAASFFGEL